jgi:hypothetical protein
MAADHAANVAAGKVFVTGASPSTRTRTAPAWGGGCCGSWTHARGRSACPRSGSTRTR